MAEIPKKVAKHVIEAMVRLENSGLPYKPGDLIGRKYEVYGLLGAGGFGVVYLVFIPENKAVIALKTAHDRYFKEAEAREVLRREADNLVKLERYAYLVRAAHVEEISGRLYIAMEYIAPDEQGLNSLQGYLKRQPPDLAQSLRWSIQFCYGMEHACSKGIRCHGDIKPDNIMISDNTVKISDFGLARLVGEVEKVAWFAKEYAAPEIIRGKGADERSDIYSFGVVLYQMATSTPKPPLAERITNVNGPMKAIIRRCVEKEPDKRYPTFKELRGDLEPLLKRETGEVIKPPVPIPLDAWELNNKGNSLTHLGRFDEAISCFDTALKINPMYAEAYSNRGIAYAKKGEDDRAILDYNKALEINPILAAAYLNRGVAYENKGEDDHAILDFNKALEINRMYADAYLNRGGAYENKGEYDRAILDFNKALKINPMDAEAYLNRGVAYKDKGEYDNAILDFNKALEINPMYVEAYNNRGIAYAKKDEYDRAILDFNKALEINPMDANAYLNRGVAYRDKGEYDSAILDYNKALEINPRDAEAYFNRGVAYGIKDKYDRAILDFNKVLEINPRDAEAYYARGAAYGKKGDYDRAISDFNKALEINPRFAEAYYVRAVAYGLKEEYKKSLNDVYKAQGLGYQVHPEFLDDLRRALGKQR